MAEHSGKRERVTHLPSTAAALADTWSPRVVGRVNDQYVKVARLEGEFTWHRHRDEDELFVVLEGHLRIRYEDGAVELGPGDCHVVPRDTLHNPQCDAPCLVMLVEPVTTQHTGDTVTAQTRSIEQQLHGASE